MENTFYKLFEAEEQSSLQVDPLIRIDTLNAESTNQRDLTQNHLGSAYQREKRWPTQTCPKALAEQVPFPLKQRKVIGAGLGHPDGSFDHHTC